MSEVSFASIFTIEERHSPLIAPYLSSPEVMTGTVFVPPPIRRGEGAKSGAPSGMMAQTQPAQGPDRERASTARPDLAREQGCSKRTLAEAMDGEGQSAVCGDPSDLAPDPRETAQRSDWRGRIPLVHFLKRAGLSKVTRPSPKGGRNPFEASGLASCTAKPCHHTTAPVANATYLGTDDYAYRLIDPTIARQGRACLPQARSLAGRPDTTGKEGPGRPYRPRKGSQSLNTGCNPAWRTAAATSPTGLSSWMANCSSSSSPPSA